MTDTTTLVPPSLEADYRRRGLISASETSDGPMLRTTLDVTAVHMSAALGRRVLEDLRVRMIAGAVMARAGVRGGPERWSFLVWENHLPKPEAMAELDRAGVSLCANGSPLLLPPSISGQEPGEPWWIQPPAAGLPPMSAVVAVTRMMACGLGPW